MIQRKNSLYLFLLAIFINIFACTAVLAETQKTTLIAGQSFQVVADEYIDTFYFPTHPTDATAAGIHDYDNQLEDYSKSGITKKITLLKKFLSRINAIHSASLTEQMQGDRQLLLNNINSQLLTLEKIRPWEKNPDVYSSGITNSAFVIMERKFASTNDRLRSLIAREKLMPAVLNEAHKNLKNPPKIYTEIAIEQLPGLITFFQKDVPLAFTDASDEELKKQFAISNADVIKALTNYQTWLKKDILPRSHGDFRIGKKAFEQKLKYDEMVDLSLDKLVSIDIKNMHQNQIEFNKIAKEIDPNKSPDQVLAELGANHPDPDKLLSSFSANFDTLIAFIKDKKIITIPSDVRPIMEETPPFMRAMTFASMDTPGPFEKSAKEAYFNVTLPEKNWSETETNQFMSQFNYPTITSVAVHETYPGHYIQFLWVQNIDDRVRKLFGATSNSEGWAHYCEQMMLDAGLAEASTKNAKEAKMLRLGQLQEALLRNARFIVGIKMHTGQMTFNQAIDFFVKEGRQSRKVGTVETKRGTSDPTYLYYTLGKLQILKLRADLEKKEGKDFNLQQFHDDFMRQGYPPIKIVRKALLHDDSETL